MRATTPDWHAYLRLVWPLSAIQVFNIAASARDSVNAFSLSAPYFFSSVYTLQDENTNMVNSQLSTEVSYQETCILNYKKLLDKPGKLAQCIPIYGPILGPCTRNRANAGPIFLVCRDILPPGILNGRNCGILNTQIDNFQEFNCFWI